MVRLASYLRLTDVRGGMGAFSAATAKRTAACDPSVSNEKQAAFLEALVDGLFTPELLRARGLDDASAAEHRTLLLACLQGVFADWDWLAATANRESREGDQALLPFVIVQAALDTAARVAAYLVSFARVVPEWRRIASWTGKPGIATCLEQVRGRAARPTSDGLLLAASKQSRNTLRGLTRGKSLPKEETLLELARAFAELGCGGATTAELTFELRLGCVAAELRRVVSLHPIAAEWTQHAADALRFFVADLRRYDASSRGEIMTLGCNWHRWPEVHARFSQTLRGALLHRAHATGAETAEAKAELERQSPGSTEYYRVAAKHHRAFATRFGHQIRALSGWERTSMAGILELFENLAALSEALAEGRPPPQFFTNHERTRARQLCDAALFAGSDDEQEQLYRSAVELDPACADVRVALGLFLGERSRFEEASAHLRTALTLDGDYDDARRLLVATLRFARLFDEALAEATLHAERNPENPEAWILRAQVLLDMGRPAEAAADLQRALDLAPQHPEAHRVMASIQIALGNTTVARRHATLHEKYRGALPPRPLHLLPIPPRSS